MLKGGAIRLGDKTSGGGYVTIASGTNFIIDGIPLALVGDKASCPTHGGVQTFVEGCQGNTTDGKGWVIEGCRLSCGSIALSSCADTFWVEDSVGVLLPSSHVAELSPWFSHPQDPNGTAYDQQFQLLDSAGRPAPNAKYRIVTSSGQYKRGVTDSEGMTMRVWSSVEEDLQVHLQGSHG